MSSGPAALVLHDLTIHAIGAQTGHCQVAPVTPVGLAAGSASEKPGMAVRVSEWICLDAQTAISTGGTGLATTVLSTRRARWG